MSNVLQKITQFKERHLSRHFEACRNRDEGKAHYKCDSLKMFFVRMSDLMAFDSWQYN